MDGQFFPGQAVQFEGGPLTLRGTPAIASRYAGSVGGAFGSAWDISTLFQTTDTSTPITASGQTVGRVSDLSPNGNHGTQSTASNEPAYTVSGGLSYLLGDGSDDKLFWPTAVGNFGTGNFEFHVCCRYPGTGETAIFAKSDTGYSTTSLPQGWFFQWAGSPVKIRFGWRLTNGAGFSSLPGATTISSGEDVVAGAGRSGTTLTIYRNGSSDATTTLSSSLGAFTSNVVQAALWSGSAGYTQHTTTRFYRWAFFLRTLSAAERGLVVGALRSGVF